MSRPPPAPGQAGGDAGEIKKRRPDAVETAPGEDHIIAPYRELNHEGQEKLIDYADDLVASGKYIKSDPDNLGKEA